MRPVDVERIRAVVRQHGMEQSTAKVVECTEVLERMHEDEVRAISHAMVEVIAKLVVARLRHG